MSELAKYIFNLLFELDKIIIPGLGCFEAIYYDVKKDSEGNLIPPSKSFLLDNNILIDDKNILIKKLAEDFNIDESRAKTKINIFVNEVKDSIKKYKKYDLVNVGTFTFDKQKNIQFSIERNANFLKSSFGLGSIKTKIITRYDKQKDDKEPVKTPSLEPLFSKQFFIKALIATPIIIILALIPKSTSKIEMPRTDLISLNIDEPELLAPKDTIKQELPKIDTVSEISKALDALTTKQNALRYEEEGSNIYYLIGGSFSNQNNAIKLRNKLKNEGYNSGIVQTENVLYRVSFNSYKTKQEALIDLFRIRAEKNDNSVWLLTLTK